MAFRKHIPNRASATTPPKERRTLRRIFVDETNSFFLQLIRYTFVGGFAAVVDIGSFILFATSLNIDYRLAVFFAFTLGALTNCTLSNAFVFNRGTLPLVVVYARHYVSGFGGLAINELIMVIFVELLHFEHLVVAKIIATGCAFIVNFALVKFYAFNHRISLFRT